MAMNESDIDMKLPLAVVKDRRLSHAGVLLYGVICGLSKDGYCFASNAYLQDMRGLSERQIRNLLRELIQYKYILVELYTKEHVSHRRIKPIGPQSGRRTASEQGKRTVYNEPVKEKKGKWDDIEY